MEEVLNQIGLSPEEVQIYLSLLNSGTQSAAQLDKSTKVKRTYVYKIVESLINKGLVTQGKNGRTTVFSPNSPDHLLTIAEKKKQEASHAERQMTELLIDLKKKYAMVESKPIVEVYEGYSGLKKIYKDTIKQGATIYAFLQNGDINPEFRQWLREEYIKMRVENKVHAKVILSSGELAKRYIKESPDTLREAKIVSASQFPFEVETNIYGNKIAMINYKNTDNPIGIIIENEAIASSLKAFFELTWKNIN